MMVNTAIIGCGQWGSNYIRVFNEIEGSRITWACDFDEDKLQRISTRYKSLETTKDYFQILNDASVQAIVITTPASTHYGIVKDALLHGKDVLVEKPFTLDYKEGLELAKIAKQNKRILMVGHTFLYNSGIEKLKEYIKNKLLGRIYYVSLIRTGLGPIRSDVNVVWDLAVHDVSILLYLLQRMPESVIANGEVYLQNNLEDVAFLNLKFQNKVLANIQVSWLDPYKIRKVTIVGSKKMVVFDDMELVDKVKLFNKSMIKKLITYNTFTDFKTIIKSGDVIIPAIKNTEPLKNECLHFLECVETRKEPLSNSSHALQVIKICEAAQKSLKKSGKEVRI